MKIEIMLTNISKVAIWFSISACTILMCSQDKDEKVEVVGNAEVARSSLVDSINTLSDLYSNHQLFPESTFEDFSYDYTFSDHEITLLSGKMMENDSLRYECVFRDSTVFDRSDFLYQELLDNEYSKSQLVINGENISLDNLNSVGVDVDATAIKPLLLWYDSGYGYTAKQISITSKRKVILLRGLDMFCNGYNCTDYLLVIIYMEAGKATRTWCHRMSDASYYSFEDIHLFDTDMDTYPELYLPKQEIVDQKDDLFLIELK